MNDKYIIYWVIGFLFLILLVTCNQNRSIKKLNNQNLELINLINENKGDFVDEVTILKDITNQLPTKTDLEIEGLRVEKRMIQSTDRRMLDVNRQSAIDVEINKLQNKIIIYDK